ncbi:UvrD-helicase domain-containing protein [Paracoccus saliphilus]|uniref:DNA 3'-5' helicase II n=1 Tax=Paracoccus saliphilus TaxID=405559 RepID=A0AA45W6G7_9RHOB|nr:ATP-dependent helicase [Paracoccus saliphilus]WCR04397.1 ATP-dependent helicase [Paracoccus saliphilus]SIT01927.1 DNA helicase-2 / ATP-dependent DNA helicase PcrA [Paracoccus saliphilus]
MDSQKLNPVDRIAGLVSSGENFVLQGGAGSGKTEGLKRVVQKVLKANPSLRIACITHTNKAADEISDRVSGDIKVSTIHSFLGEIISPFKKNIQHIFPKLFELPEFVALGDDHYNGDEKARKKEEHARFKKAHGQLENRRRTVFGEDTAKVTGKREYDKEPDTYIVQLNELIGEVNKEIRDKLAARQPNEFFYNDTAFDNFNDPSYGHDGLIALACHIFESFPLLGRIVSDRQDCIFIDEYQDTSADVVRVLLRCLPEDAKTIIGLFGDSEQAIYSDGIGSAQSHIDAKELILVEKEDNYRCSPQVIDFSNKFRTDGLEQDVALKSLDDGTLETLESRQGSVKLVYDLAPAEVDTGDKAEDRRTNAALFRSALDALVERTASEYPGYVQLKLTNKSIANDVGFGRLYQIFDDRYSEPRDRMRKTLDRLQFGELIDLVALHRSLPGDRRSYNRLIAKLRKRGYSITSVADKAKLDEMLHSFGSKDRAAYEAMEYAAECGLIRVSDSHKAFVDRRNELLAKLAGDPVFADFEELHRNGHRTKIQMSKEVAATSMKHISVEMLEQEYDDRLNELRQKNFLSSLFSTELTLGEIRAFYEYEDNEGQFSTMHKTKGTGIENVLLVIDEYGWTTEYDFVSCFTKDIPESKREIASKKLIYVACSRTKKNLVCVRLMKSQEEADQIASFFPETIKL